MSSIVYPSSQISFDHGTLSQALTIELILIQTGCPIFYQNTGKMYKKRGGGIRRKLKFHRKV